MNFIRRFATFMILGPCLAAATLYSMFLPLASWLEDAKIVMAVSHHQAVIAYFTCLFPAVLIGVFDWVAEKIDIPYRPIATAFVAWLLAVLVLRGVLAMSDISGWFVAIGALGAIPAFFCSWLTLIINGKTAAVASTVPPVPEDAVSDETG